MIDQLMNNEFSVPAWFLEFIVHHSSFIILCHPPDISFVRVPVFYANRHRKSKSPGRESK